MFFFLQNKRFMTVKSFAIAAFIAQAVIVAFMLSERLYVYAFVMTLMSFSGLFDAFMIERLLVLLASGRELMKTSVKTINKQMQYIGDLEKELNEKETSK